MGMDFRTFWDICSAESEATGLSMKALCQSLHRKHFEIVRDGLVVTQTGEAGGTMELSFPPGISAAGIALLASRALEWIDAQPNPDKPRAPRRITRLRATFNRARL